MTSQTKPTTIEVVRGRLDDQTAREVLGFWERERGFGGEAARERLAEVVCVLREGGRIAGATSVFSSELELLGGRRFWIFRNLVLDRAHTPEVIKATFEALDAEPRPAGHPTHEPPVGLCVPLDPTERARLPADAEWRDPRMIFAGYLPDGRQLRLAYFSDQVSAASHAAPFEPPYRIVPFAEQREISPEDVIGVWTREADLSSEEARRRVSELLFVAISREGQIAGLATAFVRRIPQLLADFWYFRYFVRNAYRQSGIAISLVVASRNHLEQLFVSGQDRRGLGMIFEIQNQGLKRAFPKPVWRECDVLLVGETADGNPLRVHYFPGALAPEPASDLGLRL